MSKKQKKHIRNNKLFLPLIILGGVLLIVAAFYFANQDSADSGGTPSIAVDQRSIDYGDVKFNVEKTFAVKVTNTGDGTLRFKEEPFIEILEGC